MLGIHAAISGDHQIRAIAQGFEHGTDSSVHVLVQLPERIDELWLGECELGMTAIVEFPEEVPALVQLRKVAKDEIGGAFADEIHCEAPFDLDTPQELAFEREQAAEASARAPIVVQRVLAILGEQLHV